MNKNTINAKKLYNQQTGNILTRRDKNFPDHAMAYLVIMWYDVQTLKYFCQYGIESHSKLAWMKINTFTDPICTW